MRNLISILNRISRWTGQWRGMRERGYLFEPISTTAILVSLAISAATTAASVGLEYLMASRRKATPVDRGKMDDIRISVPGYGEAILIAWGQFRTAPVWFWHTPIVHSTVTTPGRSGGKGSPRPPTPETIDHIYTTSLAGVFHDGPISHVRRIWFDNDLVYDTVNLSATMYEAEDATLAGGANSTASSACSGGFRVQGVGSGGSVEFTVTAADTSNYELGIYYTSTVDLTFKVSVNGGADVDVVCTASGGTNVVAIQTLIVALDSGANTILFSNAGAACPDLDKIEVAPQIALDPTEPRDTRQFTGVLDPSIVPPPDQDIAWPYYSHRPQPDSNGVYATNLAKYGQPSIRIYTGTETQTADPAIIADKGAANAPAYRGYSYLMIEGLQLQGGRIPNVTIEADEGTTEVNTIVEELYGKVSIAPSNLTLTALASDTIAGVIVSSRKSAADVVAELQTRFQFDLPEVDGKVIAVKRNGTSDLTIPYTELRARLDGEEMPAFDALITDIDPLLLPGRVDVNHLDQSLEYHNNTQSDMRLVGPQSDNQTVSLSLVDSADNIKKLATVLLYKPDVEGRSFRFSTGPKYMKLFPGSVVTLTLPNATHIGRIKEAKYQLPAGVCEFEAFRQQGSIYSPSGTGSTGTGLELPIAPVVSNTKGVFIDAPLVPPENAGNEAQPIVYVSMSGRGSGAWSGAFLYKEYPIGSANYELITLTDKPAGIGQTIGVLATVADTAILDTANDVEIQFYSNVTLSSATEAELTANPKLNLLAIKNPTTGEVEYVQFKTATAGTPTAPFVSNYTISDLFRGRFETDLNVGTHSSADDVVVMDSALKVMPMDLDDLNVSRNYKFVSSGQAVDDAVITEFTWTGNALAPHKISDLAIATDVSDDTLVWFQGHPRASEEPETYTVEVYSGTSRTSGLLGTLPVTTGSSHAALIVASETGAGTWDGGGDAPDS